MSSLKTIIYLCFSVTCGSVLKTDVGIMDVVGGIQKRALKPDTSECDLGDRNRPWVARFTKFIYDEHLIAMGLCRFYSHPPFLHVAHPSTW